MQTAEPSSTRKDTGIVIKILDSTYAKANLDKVDADTVQLDKYQCKTLLRIITEFEELFNGILGKWYTTPTNLEMKPRSK